MMLIWELDAARDAFMKGMIVTKIIDVIEYTTIMFRDFILGMDEYTTDFYSDSVRTLRLGFGVARGHAWRLDFGRDAPLDYAGAVVNLAARLQHMARPEGIVAQRAVRESLFDERNKKGNGQILRIQHMEAWPEKELEVWLSGDVSPSETPILAQAAGPQILAASTPHDGEARPRVKAARHRARA